MNRLLLTILILLAASTAHAQTPAAALAGAGALDTSYTFNVAASPWGQSTAWSPSSSYPGFSGTGDLAYMTNGVCTIDNSYSIGSIIGLSGSGYFVNSSGSHNLTFSSTNGLSNSGTNTVNGLIQNTGASSYLGLLQPGGGILATGTTSGYTFVQSSGSSYLSCTGGTVAQYTSGPNAHILTVNGGSCTVVGNLTAPELSAAVGATGCALLAGGGTTTFNGIPVCPTGAYISYQGAVARISTGQLNWTGAQSIPAGTTCQMTLYNSGILNTNGLTLINSGNLLIFQQGTNSTLTQGTGVFTNATSAAQTCGFGCTLTVTPPTFPSSTQVLSGGTYGYASAPSTGTYVSALTTAVSSGYAYGVSGGSIGTYTGSGFNYFSPGPNFAVSGTTLMILGYTYTGTATAPSALNVLTSSSTWAYGGTTYSGSYNTAPGTMVWSGTTYGDNGSLSNGSLTLPAQSVVLSPTSYGVGGSGSAGIAYPGIGSTTATASDVWTGMKFANSGGTATGNLTLTPTGVLSSLTIHGTAGGLAISQSGLVSGYSVAGLSGTNTGQGFNSILGLTTSASEQYVASGSTYMLLNQTYTGTLSGGGGGASLTIGGLSISMGTLTLSGGTGQLGGTLTSGTGASGTLFSGTKWPGTKIQVGSGTANIGGTIVKPSLYVPYRKEN